MRYLHSRAARRRAFTLIELLVVMSIIAVLVALTAAAVMRALVLGPQTTARAELGNFDVALASVKTDFNDIEYLPSYLVLREDNRYLIGISQGWPNSGQYAKTMALLQRMFGKRIDLTPYNPAAPSPQPRGGIDWNGDGRINNADGTAGDIVLQSHTALVFWLGGIPSTSPLACTGFGTNVTNPSPSAYDQALPPGTRVSPGNGRKGPYFDFKSNRLRQDASTMLYYVDPYGTNQPYLYFSSAPPGNNYNWNANRANGPVDCPSGLNVTVVPYLLSGNPYSNPQVTPFRWVNPKSHQIICAGRDGLFGDSTQWTTNGSTDLNGKDDQANFTRDLLGSAQN